MGPSKYTSKLALIINARSIEVIAKVLPANFLVNRGLNKDTNQIIQVIKTRYPNLAKIVK
jgi:phosphomevalonate kinase